MTETQAPIDRAVMEGKIFGTTLKRLRKEAELTQAELSDLSGIDQGAIARLERGDRSPSWETVIALCIALNVSCEVFRPTPPPRRRGRESP